MCYVEIKLETEIAFYVCIDHTDHIYIVLSNSTVFKRTTCKIFNAEPNIEKKKNAAEYTQINSTDRLSV